MDFPAFDSILHDFSIYSFYICILIFIYIFIFTLNSNAVTFGIITNKENMSYRFYGKQHQLYCQL